MPTTCTVCTHPKAKQIDLEIIRGQLSNIKLANKYGFASERNIRDHKKKHLAARIEGALKRNTERREIDLQAELSACFRRINLLLNACHEWLLDPDNPEAYSLDSRAEEITVIYNQPNEEGGRSRRVKAKLQALLDQINAKQTAAGKRTFEWIETKRADPRRLILQASETFDKHLRMLGDFTGVFRQPQKNPLDVSRETYEELIGMFLSLAQSVNPDVERPAVIELLRDMPTTIGEFLPFVEQELKAYVN